MATKAGDDENEEQDVTGADVGAVTATDDYAKKKHRGGPRRKDSIEPPPPLPMDDPVREAVHHAFVAAFRATRVGAGEYRHTYEALDTILEAVYTFISSYESSTPELRSLADSVAPLREEMSARSGGDWPRKLGSKQALKDELAFGLEQYLQLPTDYVTRDLELWELEGSPESGTDFLDIFVGEPKAAKRTAWWLSVTVTEATDPTILPRGLSATELRSRVIAGVLEKWGDGYPNDPSAPLRNERWRAGIVNNVLRKLGFDPSGFR
ncbi:MAG: hypothetical protein ACHREM_06690 [Polyangiales bacterium]